jgi:hypothetical protein
MTKVDIPPIVKMQIESLLQRLSDVVGPEFQVTFIARNVVRNNADIIVGDDKKLLEDISPMLQVET